MEVVVEGELDDESEEDELELDVKLELAEVSVEDVVREVVADDVAGVAVDNDWVEVREAGVVEPRNVHTSSGPRGICGMEDVEFLC